MNARREQVGLALVADHRHHRGVEDDGLSAQRVDHDLLPLGRALPDVSMDKPADLPGLHNIVAYLPTLMSGAVREGTEGFRSLARLGFESVACAMPTARSAATLGTACVTAGPATPETMVARREVSGTSKDYAGLYRSVNLAAC